MKKSKRFPVLFITSLVAIAGLISTLALGRPEVDPETLFETSDKCLACHNGLAAANGDDASIGTRWRSTMMAHAAKDPYWHAAVRREVLDHPKAKEAIEDKCSTCHMPMARFAKRQRGGKGEVLRHVESGVLAKGSRHEMMVEDGVSCSVCHQIKPDNFGADESYGGGFMVDTQTPLEQRQMFGPFKIDGTTARVMKSATGFVPSQASHIQRSEHCATCHTLRTHTLDKNGKEVATMAEQVPYLEWLHSDYKEAQSCQDCHMPALATAAPISSVLGKPRKEVMQHQFRGGNFLMMRLFDKNRHQLGVSALPGELEATRKTNTELLKTSAASLSVTAESAAEDGRLAFTVQVENLAGHKLPTAYPSRRVWLHVVVKDASGQTVFESGALGDDGSIDENDNDKDPLRFEPHYSEITAADQVQIYETIMGTPEGKVTTGLLSASTYLKDNRVLPSGFDKATAGKDIAVSGAARQDPDFLGGEDRVTYRVGVGDAAGPYSVSAELWYQPISHRWALNLAGVKGAEPRRFVKMYRSLPGRQTAVRMTAAQAKVGAPAIAPAATPAAETP